LLSKSGRYTSDFTEGLNRAIDTFKDSKGKSIFPRNFMIFRAGMNEYEITSKRGEGTSEFEHITKIINESIKRKRLNITPKLSYIGYNRSHNFRGYIETNEKNGAENSMKNCPVGTVIDSTVTNKNCFYLFSHETSVGTTKPPKYRIVKGMGNYKVDNLLAIIYQLCRLNPQLDGSFRRPVPIGLASKLLDRIVEKFPNVFDGKNNRDTFIHSELENVAFPI
jgi:hypothetical protein